MDSPQQHSGRSVMAPDEERQQIIHSAYDRLRNVRAHLLDRSNTEDCNAV
jgi:hypothetical protein